VTDPTARRCDDHVEEAAVLPVDIHCHGIGGIDFSRLDGLDLRAVNALAAREQVICVPTVFLAPHDLRAFVALVRDFHDLSRAGVLPYVAGFALEGPLLSSSGGTPRTGAWQPTEAEWSELCSCGPLGLRYVVISPDFATPTSALAEQRRRRSTFDLEWALRELIDQGIAPALGHFSKADPHRSADCIEEVLAVNAAHAYPVHIITDHLYNDMPLAFRHAWRGASELSRRDAEVRIALQTPWDLDGLDEIIGPVPAALIRAAVAGELHVCLNFDGEHVDLAYCRRTLDLIGADAVIAMTDRTDADVLAGEPLHKVPTSSLWYQADEAVAAGTTSLARQIANLRTLGVDDEAVWKVTSRNPRHALGLSAVPPRSNPSA
jgi:N-acetylglucosamine-6-phosphate deacetylase